MKSRKQKKRNDDQLCQPELAKLQCAFPLKISFNLCKDNLACFVGEKKNNKKKPCRVSSPPKKIKQSLPKLMPQAEKECKKIEHTRVALKTECEQIIQGSLNSILNEIEAKGIDYHWNDNEQQNQLSTEQIFDSEASQLMNAFSVNSSFSKSYASTIDVHPNIAYFQNCSYSTQTYYYDYNYKSYDQSNLYLVFPQNIQHDARTTVMIRNIPNKYTIKELSDEIDYQFENTYDFLYLPCDIKNHCNVGYGFINFLTTDYLKEFYQCFQGKKWSKFRSEKICNLTYARLQGLNSLIEHFQNSKVQKDKKYRPIIRYQQISHLVKNQQLH